MKRPDEPPPGKEAPRPESSGLEEEARKVIYEYAQALREIIKKLRQRLN
jgi:hypothetical protein